MKYMLQAGVALAAVWVAWAIPNQAASPAATGAAEPGRGPARARSEAAVFQGPAVQLYTAEDCWKRFGRLIPEIADLGADTVMLVVHGYQDHAGSMNLRLHGAKTPSADDIGRMITHAHHHGLRVILMPIVLLEYPRGNEWRGRIKPPDLDGWFQRYTEFIIHFARISEEHDAEVLMIGSELVSLENSTQRWRRLINEVKQFYRGKLGYSANWDHYRPIEFWDQVDVVGMTSYYKLADEPGPTLASVVKAWAPSKRKILEFQREVGKPIVFTEIGWCSQEGAAVEAWNYYRKQEATPAGHAEQAVLYEAFMRVWADVPGIGGYIWWEWSDAAGGADDYGYTPRGKPAELLLREWFARGRTQ
ncbi:MAG: hypothetical protein V3T70_08715 [Phycisphaerae bacterium]